MTKTQKIWLYVFLAIFIVPEILWSPVVNILNSLLQSGQRYPQEFRENFLLNNQNENLLRLTITIQLIGIALLLVSIIKNRKSINNILFWLLLIVISLVAIVTAFAFYLVVIFNPSFP